MEAIVYTVNQKKRMVYWWLALVIISACNPTVKDKIHSVSVYCEEPKYNLHLSDALEAVVYYDYHQALNCAKKTNRPLFAAFTGHTTVSTSEFQFTSWLENNEIREILNNNYVVAVLLTDDKTPLDAADRYTSVYSGREITTIAQKNGDLQMWRYHTNAPPYYVIEDTAGQSIIEPHGVFLDRSERLPYLKRGLKALRARK